MHALKLLYRNKLPSQSVGSAGLSPSTSLGGSVIPYTSKYEDLINDFLMMGKRSPPPKEPVVNVTEVDENLGIPKGLRCNPPKCQKLTAWENALELQNSAQIRLTVGIQSGGGMWLSLPSSKTSDEEPTPKLTSTFHKLSKGVLSPRDPGAASLAYLTCFCPSLLPTQISPPVSPHCQ